MSQIINSTYEVLEKIGAGGGGSVFLANHLRLGKRVVLKAYNRRITARPELLRREVDVLKDLSHTYIPKVYDFFVEDDTFYTVMDYIEGESLDRPLKRGEKFSQAQVIKWAKQLLQALCYLHSPTHGTPPKGFVHSDIKPANLMRTPDNNICLIDFNIALALGEDNVIGCSEGYASPEHYGLDYSSGGDTMSTGGRTTSLVKHSKAKTLSSNSVSSSSKRIVVPDVRSDIYSTGATLYHLLSGHRPSKDAKGVVPLSKEEFSPQVIKIISKAMNPNPDFRYQTAEEMLWDFMHLRGNDPRVKCQKRTRFIMGILLSTIFISGASSAFVGLKRIQTMESWLKLAEYSKNALAEGDTVSAIQYALEALPPKTSIFQPDYSAEAERALADALGVYDLSDGFKSSGMIELPSAPFKIAASPEGSYLAVVYAYEVVIFQMEDVQEIVRLPVQKSALSDVLFVNETQIIYAGEQGVTAYDLEERKILWTGEIATTLTISGDKTIVAAVNRDEDHVVIYRVSDGTQMMKRSFHGQHLSVPENDTFAALKKNIFALNQDGSILAVSYSNGEIRLLMLETLGDEIIIFDELDHIELEGGFYGEYFAFLVKEDKKSTFYLWSINPKEANHLAKYDSRKKMSLKVDETGIYMAEGTFLIEINPETLSNLELANTGSVNIREFSVGKEYTFIATENKQFSFYDSGAHLSFTEGCTENCDFIALTDEYAVIGNRNEPFLRILKLESHKEAQLLSYDAYYFHQEARISQDGQTAMLFGYRGFCIYRMDGEFLAQVELPNSEQIYDQQFVKGEEDSWLEVIWYDGTIRRYSAKDASLLSETVGESPSKDLNEEFYTSKYRIASSSHGAPEVYSLESGELVATLEKDSYLSYVTEEGDYLITEYISAEGERYGLLLDKKFQTRAYLPNLCDVKDGMLVFDYEAGHLRQSHLYSLPELIELGESYIENSRKENGEK